MAGNHSEEIVMVDMGQLVPKGHILRKEKHAMRYTHHRGLARVSRWVKLKFAAMNRKKLAKWLWEEPLFLDFSLVWEHSAKN